MSRTLQLTTDPKLLEAALEGLEAQRKRIEDQIRQVRSVLGRGRTSAPAETNGLPRKRERSPA
ncbi:MAG TPA: hypothetical protein VEQ63_05900, partial [Bryobacteraceae bacterium]|nr:hypothetical protein [Bryobacteraceae bacterium]